ncbi:hypothetical protein LEMLEM_LOCUS6821 [Lemmus lemmus]
MLVSCRRLLMNHRSDSSNWSASCTITTIKKKKILPGD